MSSRDKRNLTVALVRSVGGGRFVERVAIDAIGASGGILLFWDSPVFKMLEKLEV